MKLNEAIDKIEVGIFLSVCADEIGILGGLVINKLHVEGAKGEIFDLIKIQINKQKSITLDSREDYKVLSIFSEDGKNLLLQDKMDYYCMEEQQPFMDILNQVIRLWDDYDDLGKNDMVEIIESLLDNESIKDIIQRMKADNMQILELADKLIQKNEADIKLIEKQADFTMRYEWFKGQMTKEIGAIYDYILYDILGLKWLTEVG